MENTVIILNGPPSCGKDTIAVELSRYGCGVHMEFKDHLYKCTATLFNMDLDLLKRLATDRVTKEVPTDELQIPWDGYVELCRIIGRNPFDPEFPYKGPISISPRQAMIYTSEVVMKPNFGESYFGKAAAQNITIAKGAVFSDGGFIEEIVPIITKVGVLNTFIVKLYRNGCSFEGDSRDYFPEIPELARIPTAKIENNSTIEKAVDSIISWIDYERITQAETFGG